MRTTKFVILIIVSIFLSACAKEGDFQPHLKNKQDALAYINPQVADKMMMSKLRQEQLYHAFLKHYYSPWTGKNTIYPLAKIKSLNLDSIKSALNNPGWNVNKHKHQLTWVEAIVNNMQFEGFPNANQNAIIIRSTNLRGFPTNKPSFTALNKPGWFYPFDNFQESYLPHGLPVRIIQTTKDESWDLVLSNGTYGWVDADDLAYVNKPFIKNWMDTKKYIAVKNDNISVVDTNGEFQFKTRMGAIYPIEKVDENAYVIKIVVKAADGEALIRQAFIPKDKAYLIPKPLTEENVATVANLFIGMPYGWGGLYGYRDCSATTRNIMAYFGIWLPRNSTMQAKMGGESIDLSKLSKNQKLKIIKKDAIPFLTLVHLPGHIMLYLGIKDGVEYVFHDMWGLHTMRMLRSDGRAVVGRTLITPIEFGHDYLNVRSSLLDKAMGITIIGANSHHK